MGPGGGGSPSPVLSILQDELERSTAALEGQGDKAPYFVTYAVSDGEKLRMTAENGAISEREDGRTRLLDIDLRLGSYELDSTHPIEGMGFMGRGAPTLIPLEDDEHAIRTAIWLATDRAYKQASQRFGRVRASKTVKVEDEDRSADLSKEEPVQYVEAPSVLEVDRDAWEGRLRSYSAAFKSHRWIHGSLGARLTTRRRHTGFAGSNKEELVAAAQRLGEELKELRTAPVVDDFSGPVLFEGPAAAQIVGMVFRRQLDGTPPPKPVSGGRSGLASRVGQRLLPRGISLIDDPTITSWNGHAMLGGYRVDDQGVLGTKVVLVDNGILKTLLMTRTPRKGFETSTGHASGFMSGRHMASPSNLILSGRGAIVSRNMRAKLLAEVRKANAPHVFIVRKLYERGMGALLPTADFRPQSPFFPLVMIRVTPDGKEQMVRGAMLERIQLKDLERLVAVGRDSAVSHADGGAGLRPLAVASPAILLDRVVVRRLSGAQPKPPIIPPPTARDQVRK